MERGPDGKPRRKLPLLKDAYRYMRLQFKDDVLVGALSIGRTEHVGVLRGLIQARTSGWLLPIRGR